MHPNRLSVLRTKRPKFVLSKYGLRVVRIVGLLKVLRKSSRIGNRGKFSSVIRTGKLILRIVEDAKRLNGKKAMDLVDTVEHLAQHWVEEIHRIVD